ncbi:hypothetical protein ACFYNO_02360 [Kitasatospora sp. NPDC006697]|uniref:hypothetical protein n=1 Tax=Kitasatospora sp. NPDC006697 TaxID=3364020 RepID=UPI0036AFED71
MIEVGQYGAFGVNCVGMARDPFPLSFSAQEAAGCWQLRAAAVRAVEVADLLTGATANDTVVVVDLATNSFLDEKYRQLPLARIAAAQGVEPVVHPRGEWAAGASGLGEEFLVLRKRELGGFLGDDWAPYELGLVDLPAPPGAEELDQLALAVGTASSDEPLLPQLPLSQWYFSGHDDCYLWLETRNAALPSLLLARLLALAAGAALLAETGAEPVRVPEPEPSLAAALLAENPHWVGAVGEVTAEAVRVDLVPSKRPWRLGERVPEAAGRYARLGRPDGGWTLGQGAPAAAA